uniref:Uncharacterized protein n=1 Tax=Arundo donax TaxID=35708 RepID=A0A0A9B141_ARUDO
MNTFTQDRPVECFRSIIFQFAESKRLAAPASISSSPARSQNKSSMPSFRL